MCSKRKRFKDFAGEHLMKVLMIKQCTKLFYNFIVTVRVSFSMSVHAKFLQANPSTLDLGD